MADKETLEKFEVTEEELDELETEAASGTFRGVPTKTEVGRPRMFGQEMHQVGFREPIQKIAQIDARANQLGMRRSDYLRYLVDVDLASV